jgi:hypothetical protein
LLYLKQLFKIWHFEKASEVKPEEYTMAEVACENCGKIILEENVKYGDCKQCSLCDDCVANWIAKDCKECKDRKE